VALEQNQHSGGEANPEGLKLEARRAEPGPLGSWRGASHTSPPAMGLREHCI